VSALKTYNYKLERSGLTPLWTRFGLATGEAIVGNIGSTEQFEYTSIGDNVNSASRLEGINKIYGTQILINESCQNAIQSQFITREIDLVRAKGKQKPMRIFEVLSKQPEEISPCLQKFLDIFHSGLLKYRETNFHQSLDLFKECLRIAPQDQATQVFIRRCEQFQNTPPRPEWDGIFDAKNK
jgi:adenylate cyclase